MGNEDRTNNSEPPKLGKATRSHSYKRTSIDSSSSFVATASLRALAPTPRYADGGSSAHDDRRGRLSMRQQHRREPRSARSKKPADKAVPRQGRAAAKSRPSPCRD